MPAADHVDDNRREEAENRQVEQKFFSMAISIIVAGATNDAGRRQTDRAPNQKREAARF
jgi:hypothetical protein